MTNDPKKQQIDWLASDSTNEYDSLDIEPLIGSCNENLIGVENFYMISSLLEQKEYENEKDKDNDK